MLRTSTPGSIQARWKTPLRGKPGACVVSGMRARRYLSVVRFESDTTVGLWGHIYGADRKMALEKNVLGLRTPYTCNGGFEQTCAGAKRLTDKDRK